MPMRQHSIPRIAATVSLAAICLAGTAPAAQPTVRDNSAKQWNQDREWQETRYGGWGGPGVRPAPGPMDAILLKDYAPKSSVVVTETMVAKAKYPAIDVHTHTALARTPA